MDRFVFDAHSDLLLDVLLHREKGEGSFMQVILPDMRAASMRFRVLAAWIDELYLPELALRRALDIISAFYQESKDSSDFFLVLGVHDFERSFEQDKVGFILALEGAEPIYNDLNLLYIFYELGVRVITLTWNNRNYVADGIKVGSNGGLTAFGKELVEEMNRLKMVVDVSHLSERGFWDTIELAENVMASHSNAFSLCKHPRNMKDEQIKAIAEKGGVIGVTAVPRFLKEDGNASVNDYVRHVEYICDLVGADGVAVGFDFAEHIPGMGDETVTGLVGDKDVLLLGDKLEGAGFGQEDVDKILGRNLLSFFSKAFE